MSAVTSAVVSISFNSSPARTVISHIGVSSISHASSSNNFF